MAILLVEEILSSGKIDDKLKEKISNVTEEEAENVIEVALAYDSQRINLLMRYLKGQGLSYNAADDHINIGLTIEEMAGVVRQPYVSKLRYN